MGMTELIVFFENTEYSSVPSVVSYFSLFFHKTFDVTIFVVAANFSLRFIFAQAKALGYYSSHINGTLYIVLL